jgi:hypothetical protein
MFSDVKYKKFNSSRTFGVEIEISAISKMKVNSALKSFSNQIVLSSFACLCSSCKHS